MAHKTFSQEQYIFAKSSLVVKFKFEVVSNLKFNHILYLLLIFQNSSFYFETNIFFLSNFKLKASFSDKRLFLLGNY